MVVFATVDYLDFFLGEKEVKQPFFAAADLLVVYIIDLDEHYSFYHLIHYLV